jgi:hypothetical protein
MPVRRRAGGRIIRHRRDELEPYDVADHDDDESTDHLARLADPDWLARVVELERELARGDDGPRTD